MRDSREIRSSWAACSVSGMVFRRRRSQDSLGASLVVSKDFRCPAVSPVDSYQAGSDSRCQERAECLPEADRSPDIQDDRHLEAADIQEAADDSRDTPAGSPEVEDGILDIRGDILRSSRRASSYCPHRCCDCR